MKKINIAIDGPSGVGKSTVAEILAKKYSLNFINTGSFYRAIALYFYKRYGKENYDSIADEQFVLSHWNIEHISLDKEGNVLLDNENVARDLRKDEISWGASLIARYKEIRVQVVKFLQNYSKTHKGVIMDGRDTTFVVLPHAELKIFLWADPAVRAQRRVKQNEELGFECNFEKILEEIELRDQQDMNRAVDPLHQTEDAIRVDTSFKTVEEVVAEISELVEERMKNAK
ncbi:(d)CMP kinase [Mycoplasma procyoni]|uniref:(d)CMP kinase n=1 Tax=Mycoplasma procyoni TaxID=568784 RepID=UPI00197B0A16|nr:(d)CMP kinase [Mycoplasma procyoni]MBN3534424.1 (d)CMP kinase [Mycoplasma procyoni]